MTAQLQSPDGAPVDGLGHGPDDGPRRFAAIWSRAVYPRATSAMAGPEFERALVPLARALGAALHTRPFNPSPGRGVGAALVTAGCTNPDALPQILGVVDAYLVLYCRGAAPLPADEGQFRCGRLQHALAAGYARALGDHIRTEQEALTRAARQAQLSAERALAAREAKLREAVAGSQRSWSNRPSQPR